MKNKILGFIFVVMIGIIFGFASCVWFSPKKSISNKIDINISSKDVLVSTNAKDFKKIINREDIINSKGIIPNDFYKVSTVLDTDSVKFYENNNKTIEEALKDHYIKFSLFFKTDKEEDIYISNKSNIIYQGETTELEDSIRVGFIVGSNKLIWEPNYDTHTISSINNSYTTSHLYIKEKDSKKQVYKGIKDKDNLEEVNTIGTKKNNIDSSELKLSLGKGITKVDVYIWIESNDIDAYKELEGNYLNYTLDFIKE